MEGDRLRFTALGGRTELDEQLSADGLGGLNPRTYAGVEAEGGEEPRCWIPGPNGEGEVYLQFSACLLLGDVLESGSER